MSESIGNWYKESLMDQVSKIALIGVTHPHSTAHLRTLNWIDQITAVPVCDSDPVALRDFRAQVDGKKLEEDYTDLDALLARDDVPVVFVCMRNDQTPDVLIRAAEAGKHIITEKPVAPSVTKLEPALAAVESAGTKLTVCFQNRYQSISQEIYRLVGEGILGEPMSVELRMITSQVKHRNPKHWLFNKSFAGGGILSWLGCHYLDLICYLMRDRVEEVSAILATRSGETIDVEDSAALSLRFQSGMIGTFQAGYMLPFSGAGYSGASYDSYIAIRGTAGNIVWSPAQRDHPSFTAESTAPAWEAACHRTFHYQLPECDAYGGMYGVQFVNDFLEAVQTDSELMITGQDALHVLRILDAAYESDETGRRVQVRR
jgi:predicted dehydrogenase